MKYVLIFAKTSYTKTPYDVWLRDSGIIPLILVAEEFASGYAHLKHIYAFKNYDQNQRVQQKAIELVSKYEVTAVFARAEADILRAAQLRDLAFIQGQNLQSALAYRNKVTMKNHLRNSGVTLPAYQALDNSYQIFSFIALHGFPVVIKPTTESGSFGTCVIKNENELNLFLENSALLNLEIETYIQGQMYHIDGLIVDGKLQFIQPSRYVNDCLSFREDEYLGSVTVSPASPVHAKLVQATKKILASMPSPKHFVFHCELWERADGQIVFCEIASRTGGGIINSSTEKTFGVNLDKEWFFAECGLPSSIPTPTYAPGGFILIPPRKGILQKLPSPEAVPDWVIETNLSGKEGQNYNGGVKSGLFLAAYVLKDSSESAIACRIRETAQWFQENTVWGK